MAGGSRLNIGSSLEEMNLKLISKDKRGIDRAEKAVSGSLIPEVFLDCSLLQS